MLRRALHVTSSDFCNYYLLSPFPHQRSSRRPGSRDLRPEGTCRDLRRAGCSPVDEDGHSEVTDRSRGSGFDRKEFALGIPLEKDISSCLELANGRNGLIDKSARVVAQVQDDPTQALLSDYGQCFIQFLGDPASEAGDADMGHLRARQPLPRDPLRRDGGSHQRDVSCSLGLRIAVILPDPSSMYRLHCAY